MKELVLLHSDNERIWIVPFRQWKHSCRYIQTIKELVLLHSDNKNWYRYIQTIKELVLLHSYNKRICVATFRQCKNRYFCIQTMKEWVSLHPDKDRIRVHITPTMIKILFAIIQTMKRNCVALIKTLNEFISVATFKLWKEIVFL